MDHISKLLTRGVEAIYPSTDVLEKTLRSGKKLRVYMGVDPTGIKLHVGHSIGLSKLQQFADAGHEAILLFGTGTVLVGDPSQRKEARKRITSEEIEENIKTWKKQVASIIDFNKVTIKQNADWLLKLTLEDLVNIMSHISATQLFKRDSFQSRIEQGGTVWYHETLYPLLQGYDSVAMDVDLEIGGTDQTFNMLIGRELMQKMKGKEKYVLTTPMIVGTDGRQMSKSTGNCVWLTDTPENMYGKIMSIPDDQMTSYSELLTNLSEKDVERLSPIDQKKNLAFSITERFHSMQQATAAQEHFEKTVQHKEAPDNIQTLNLKEGTLLADCLVDAKMIESKSEAKRLMLQGGIELDGEKIIDPTTLSRDGTIKIGKRKFARLIKA